MHHTIVASQPPEIDMASLVMMRRGLGELLFRYDDAKYRFNPGSSDHEILNGIGEALLGDRYDNPLLTQAAHVDSARSFKQGHEAFRQCLADILIAASDSTLGRTPKEERALHLLLSSASAETLLRVASQYLVESEYPVTQSIDEFKAKTKTPNAAGTTLDTLAGPRGSELHRFRELTESKGS